MKIGSLRNIRASFHESSLSTKTVYYWETGYHVSRFLSAVVELFTTVFSYPSAEMCLMPFLCTLFAQVRDTNDWKSWVRFQCPLIQQTVDPPLHSCDWCWSWHCVLIRVYALLIYPCCSPHPAFKYNNMHMRDKWRGGPEGGRGAKFPPITGGAGEERATCSGARKGEGWVGAWRNSTLTCDWSLVHMLFAPTIPVQQFPGKY